MYFKTFAFPISSNFSTNNICYIYNRKQHFIHQMFLFKLQMNYYFQNGVSSLSEIY